MDLISETFAEPKPASLGSRIAAALIDLILMAGIMAGIGKLYGETYYSSETGFSVSLNNESALIFMAAWILLIPVVEGLTGSTIGKKVIGLRVVKKNGGQSSLLQSLLRHFFDFIDYFLFIGLIIASTNKNKQRIGDLVANTIVIKK
jgi:uncharacterized RDD family membrane protein YckC